MGQQNPSEQTKVVPGSDKQPPEQETSASVQLMRQTSMTYANTQPEQDLDHPRKVKMLIKVQLGAKKKYIKLEEVCFSDFLSAVQQKFMISENTTLKVTDDQGIEVDEDVFPELATTKEMCFIIHTDDELLFAETSKNSVDFSDLTEFGASSNQTEYVTLTTCDLTVLQQGVVEGPSSPSLTDTLSVSSRLSSSDSGSQMLQPLTDSFSARNKCILKVFNEYKAYSYFKDSRDDCDQRV
ncbi:uncharacterized protein LOC113056689 [Carassius auratus]|uniref:Uncharacterized protein LOC113056689 n=1 Tax=Carassius auratus TaxID=7957 RepID=A0A6P6L475_CARAU|nr:uncharacterized protein LOC113056689 [Carassius auratus]